MLILACSVLVFTTETLLRTMSSCTLGLVSVPYSPPGVDFKHYKSTRLGYTSCMSKDLPTHVI